MFKVVIVVVAVVVMALVPYSHSLVSSTIQENEDNNRPGHPLSNSPRDVVIVATMDGKVSAFDVQDEGKQLWELRDGGPLLSGTMLNSEGIAVNGVLLNLLPALDGDLYMYSSEAHTLEPMPLNTDLLLEASMRMGTDAVAGGKSVSTFGVDPYTGVNYYECRPNECNPIVPNRSGSVLMIRRIQRSIRAVDGTTGRERWNLSVAEFDMSLSSSDTINDLEYVDGTRIVFRPPNGMLTLVDGCGNEQWTTSVQSHIVRAWRIKDNVLNEISLFNTRNLYADGLPTDREFPDALFYLGNDEMGMPFIVQSPKVRRSSRRRALTASSTDVLEQLVVPRVFGLTAERPNQLVPINDVYQINDNAINTILYNAYEKSASSKIIKSRYGTPRNSNGPLMVVTHVDGEVDTGRACIDTKGQGISVIGQHQIIDTSSGNGGELGMLIMPSPQLPAITERPRRRHTHTQIMDNLSDYIWKAMGAFATTLMGMVIGVRMMGNGVAAQEQDTSEPQTPTESTKGTESSTEKASTPSESFVPRLTFNRISTPILRAELEIEEHRMASVPYNLESCTDESASPAPISKPKREHYPSTSSIDSNNVFTSRFSDEYIVEKMLGHGGFGVVFKARSKYDQTEYAIKRIAVASREKAIEKVLREVRALAPLDHPNIVRYFSTWMEHPPVGWQEKFDEELLARIKSGKVRAMLEDHGIAPNPDQVVSGKTADSMVHSFEMPPTVGDSVSWENTSEAPEVSTAPSSSSSSDDSSGVGKFAAKPLEASSSGGIIFENSKKEATVSSSMGIVFEKDSAEEKVEKSDKSEQKAVVSTEKSSKNDTPLANSRVYVYIVMQLCKERTLHDWLLRNTEEKQRPLAKMKEWIRQMASALRYLHSKNMIHRDVKPKNVLFALDKSDNGHDILKIGDFGLVKSCVGECDARESFDGNSNHTDNVGTRSYMSPEQLSGKPYTAKVDVFSLGLISCELIVPFGTAMERTKTLTELQQGRRPQILDNYKFAEEFISWLTAFDADRRPSAADVLKSAFLSIN